MLQRIQTIFLFLITILSVLLLFTPFQRINTATACYILYLNPGNMVAGVKPLIYFPFALDLLITALSLAIIFLYKKRPLQMKLCTLLALCSFFLTFLMLTLDYIDLTEVKEMNVTYHYAAFFPAINIILAFIAKRFIKGDEELVKSADRIR